MTDGAGRWQVAVEGARIYEEFRVPSEFAPLARHLLAALPPPQGNGVLDLACGTGIVARLAAEAGPARVVGIDVNPAMIERARQAAPALEWRLGDASALSFEDGEFDLVYCQQGLQHFADPARVLAEAHRVLRSGGCLGAAVWQPGADDGLTAALGRAVGQHAGEDAARIATRALGDEARLRALLESAGFDAIRIATVRLERTLEDPESEIGLHLGSSGKLSAIVAAMPDDKRRALIQTAADILRQGAGNGPATVTRGSYIGVAQRK